VTFCSWYPVIAIVRRGPVRGPSHLREQCNKGHQRHGSVVSVQLARTVHEAVVLIIRTEGHTDPAVKGYRRTLRAILGSEPSEQGACRAVAVSWW
jgi:hypothetical protein